MKQAFIFFGNKNNINGHRHLSKQRNQKQRYNEKLKKAKPKQTLANLKLKAESKTSCKQKMIPKKFRHLKLL